MKVRFDLIVRQHDYEILMREASNIVVEAKQHDEEKQYGRITVQIASDWDMHMFFTVAKAIGRDQLIGNVDRLSDTVEFQAIKSHIEESIGQ